MTQLLTDLTLEEAINFVIALMILGVVLGVALALLYVTRPR